MKMEKKKKNDTKVMGKMKNLSLKKISAIKKKNTKQLHNQ